MSRRNPRIEPGQRFGRWMVLREAVRTRPQSPRHLVCRCDCGTERPVKEGSLWHGYSTSCGCKAREKAAANGRTERSRAANRAKVPPNRTHNHSYPPSPTYRTWEAMWSRCVRPYTNGFEYYGGRGVTVCERWRIFAKFLADMGERPDNRTLDRIDPDGNYEPDNCRWATRSEQARNTRRRKALAA